ncbi:MAG: AAA family ATPase [Betaproteobacteria bacterium]
MTAVPPTKVPGAPDADAQAQLVAGLQRSLSAGAGAPRARLIETHISYVILAEGFAYKIKKAVRLPFLDFRTLAARRFYCDEEVRLNRRYAHALYLDVISISGTVDAPVMGGDETPIEFAVRMREFPQAALASEALARGEVTPADVDALAATIAAAHEVAGIAPAGGPFGAPDSILSIATQNFAQIRPLLETGAEFGELDALLTWTTAEHARRAAVMAGRRDQGFVRECHGDLHLGNIAFVDGVLTLFDCIEFNEEMRWIDTMSEVAFTTMDLRDRGRSDFSHRFLDRYLGLCGDYAGLGVLRFYLVYRAMVRAKIARMRAGQLDAGEAKTAALADYRGYLRLANGYTDAPAPAIVITHGLSGSGKTRLSQALLEQSGAVRIRTDVERTRTSGRTKGAREVAAIEAGAYTPEATRATYAHVVMLARYVVDAGFIAIIDGAFLMRWQRQAFRDLAQELGLPFVIVSLVASVGTLRDRIAHRLRDGTDASEADAAVLEHQLRTKEPLDADEASDVVVYDSEAPTDADDELARLNPVLDRFGPAKRGRAG